LHQFSHLADQDNKKGFSALNDCFKAYYSARSAIYALLQDIIGKEVNSMRPEDMILELEKYLK